MITDRIDAVTKIPAAYLRNDPPAPRSVKIELTGRCNYQCLRGDTLVDTIDGPVSIKALAERGGSVPVYTYRDGEVFIDDAINVRKYGENQQLVRVRFDDGTHIDCTPDHQFLTFRLSRGESIEEAIEAQHLVFGARIRAYRENHVGGNRISICAGRHFRLKRARMVMEYILGRKLLRTEIVHHIDHDTLNDSPNNLELVESTKAHFALHPEFAQRMRDNNPARLMTPEWKEKIRVGITGKRRTLEQRLRYRESKLGSKNPRFTDGKSAHRSRIQDINHKVVGVEWLTERDDVYCLTVPSTGWFFANKVLVKNCGFCALRTRKVQPKTDMPFEFFQRITQEMRDAGVEEIGCFYLGESCTAPELLVKAIAHCKAIGFPYVFLTTNGSLMTPELATLCMSYGLDSLKFSINAADEEQFEQVMQVKGKLFHQALDNLAKVAYVKRENGYKTGLYASSIRYDDAQREKMDALIKERVLPYVDQWYELPLYSMGSLATQREEELGYRPTAGNQGRLGALRDPLPCWSVMTEAHVTADGMLSACCFDADGRWAMADLNKVDFMSGWNSKIFQELRSAHLKKDVSGTICEQCVAYK